MEKNIVWLASYPKSGNTWFRLFLDALIKNKDEIVLTEALNSSIYSQPINVENLYPFDAFFLPNNTANQLQKFTQIKHASYQQKVLFLKIHNYFYAEDSSPVIPIEVTWKAIYFVRNPLDISISYSNHNAQALDTIIKFMNDEKAEIGGYFQNQFNQNLNTWSNHVESWLNHDLFPVKMIRYEDLLVSPFEIFSACLDFLEMKYSEKQINKAIELTSFHNLQSIEKEKGFLEKPDFSKMFFNSGKSNVWKEILSETQQNEIIGKNSVVMEKLGYL